MELGATGGWHLAQGGPFYRLERATRLVRNERGDGRRQLIAVMLLTWVPLVVLGGLERLVGDPVSPLLSDPTVHVRLLVGLPLLLLAESVFAAQCRRILERLHAQSYLRHDDEGHFLSLLQRTSRLRESAIPELILLAIALFFGLIRLEGILPQGGVFHSIAHAAPITAVGVYYSLVSLPIFLFLLGRLLWRWMLWVRILWNLAHLDLRLAPTHADRRGGIGFLKEPTTSFFSILLLAIAALLSAAWAAPIFGGAARLAAFRPQLIAFVGMGLILACGPLLFFVPKLFTLRREARHAYGGLTLDHARQFDERWIRSGGREHLLGTPDMSSLIDLTSSYRETVEKISVLIFDPRDLVQLLLAMTLPMLPLILSQVPLSVILTKLGHAVFM